MRRLVLFVQSDLIVKLYLISSFMLDNPVLCGIVNIQAKCQSFNNWRINETQNSLVFYSTQRIDFFFSPSLFLSLNEKQLSLPSQNQHLFPLYILRLFSINASDNVESRLLWELTHSMEVQIIIAVVSLPQEVGHCRLHLHAV